MFLFGKQPGAGLNSKDDGKAGMQIHVEPESGFVRVMFFGTKPAKQSALATDS